MSSSLLQHLGQVPLTCVQFLQCSSCPLDLSLPTPMSLCLQQLPIGAEAVGKGADDLEEEGEDADEYFRLGAQDEHEADFAKLQLKGDHQNRWAEPATSGWPTTTGRPMHNVAQLQLRGTTRTPGIGLVLRVGAWCGCL